MNKVDRLLIQSFRCGVREGGTTLSFNGDLIDCLVYPMEAKSDDLRRTPQDDYDAVIEAVRSDFTVPPKVRETLEDITASTRYTVRRVKQGGHDPFITLHCVLSDIT